VVDTSAEFRVKPVEPNRGRFCALRMEGFAGHETLVYQPTKPLDGGCCVAAGGVARNDAQVLRLT